MFLLRMNFHDIDQMQIYLKNVTIWFAIKLYKLRIMTWIIYALELLITENFDGSCMINIIYSYQVNA